MGIGVGGVVESIVVCVCRMLDMQVYSHMVRLAGGGLGLDSALGYIVVGCVGCILDWDMGLGFGEHQGSHMDIEVGDRRYGLGSDLMLEEDHREALALD